MTQPVKPANRPVKQLIVNADDFGMTEGVNRAILEAHQHGIVTSTTLLATGAASANAIAAGREFPRLGIGVHLNLSEGQPVSPPSKIPSLVNAQGQLHLTPGKLCAAILTMRARTKEIEIELRAQIAKVIEAGIIPTHLDGHMHVHVLPGVCEVVIKLAQEFQIPAVRCPAEPFSSILRAQPKSLPLNPKSVNPTADSPENVRGKELGGRPADGQVTAQRNVPADGDGEMQASQPSHNQSRSPNRGHSHSGASLTKRRLIAVGVTLSALRLRRQLQKANLLYPANFYGIVATGALDLPTILDILRTLPEPAEVASPNSRDSSVSELMCHPGYLDADLTQTGGTLQHQRETERAALTAPEAIAQATAERITLITYGDLPGLRSSSI